MRVLGLILPLVFVGCYAPHNTIPKSLFLQIKEVEKPKIESLDDIQKSYIELFESYQLNLNLLKTIQNIQN